ncbi:MAG: LPS export ABC transporter periplasmic protein LptC [Rhodospirillaceae bacterium]
MTASDTIRPATARPIPAAAPRPASAGSAREPAKAEPRAALPGWMHQGRGHGKPRIPNEHYSQLVRRLKIALPLAALALIALVAVWPYMSTSQTETSKIDKSQTTMVNARYFSRDKADRPFSVSAKSAALVPDSPSLVDLIQPEGEMTQTNGSWLTVTAERGRYNQDDGRLLMLDNVHLLRDDGFEFVTDEAEIDTKSGNAWGNHTVTGQGPSGEIHADGFVATDRGKTISFTHSSSARVLSGPPQTGSGNGPPP